MTTETYVSEMTPIDEIRDRVRAISYASVPLPAASSANEILSELTEIVDAQADWFIDTFNYVRELVRAGRLDMAIVIISTAVGNSETILKLLLRIMGAENLNAMVSLNTGVQSDKGTACVEAANELTEPTAARSDASIKGMLPKLSEKIVDMVGGEDGIAKMLDHMFGDRADLGEDLDDGLDGAA